MNFRLDTQRILHGVKTALACLVGFAITQVMPANINQWIIITVLVVMCAQPNVGSVIQKSYMRFLGTVGGSLLAALTLMLFGADSIAIAATICFAAIAFGYLATGKSTYNEAGTLGAVTTVIILLGTQPTLLTALERFLEISAGIFIAALISQFVFPIHARHHLRLNQAKTLRKLKSFYLATLIAGQTDKGAAYYQELDEEIVQSFLAQRKLAKEAVREILGQRFSLPSFEHILRCEKDILRSISFMHYAYREASNRQELFSPIHTLREFHDAVCETLQQIADSLESRQPAHSRVISLPSTHVLKASINATIENYSVEDRLYPHAYLFCAEILVMQLNQLATLLTGSGKNAFNEVKA